MALNLFFGAKMDSLRKTFLTKFYQLWRIRTIKNIEPNNGGHSIYPYRQITGIILSSILIQKKKRAGNGIRTRDSELGKLALYH